MGLLDDFSRANLTIGVKEKEGMIDKHYLLHLSLSFLFSPNRIHSDPVLPDFKVMGGKRLPIKMLMLKILSINIPDEYLALNKNYLRIMS